MACICNRIASSKTSLTSVCIGQLWIFQDLSPAEREALTKEAFRREFTPGENIFMQGSPANKMFLIKAGRVKLNKLLENGTEITLDIRKAGDFLGEHMLSEDIHYPVSAKCLEAVLICGFTKEQFEKLVLHYPNIGLQVIRNLSKRISFLTTRVGSMSVTNLVERLYEVLTNVAQEHGTPGHRGFSIPFPLTHEELSFLVGAHRVSITRAMKDLKHSGRILQDGKKLIICREANVS